LTQQYIISLGKDALLLTLLLSAPMLIAGLLVGMLIGILQAVTQIHEMTITFVPKIIAVFVILIIFLPWLMNLIIPFTIRLFESIPTLIR